MTLQEIAKLIDEADLMLEENGECEAYISIRSERRKIFYKYNIENILKREVVLSFYKRDKDSGKMTLLGKVDHLTKTVIKKLDDMTEEEIKQLDAKYCKGRTTCKGCPFRDTINSVCLGDFKLWKKRIEDNKDKEFEIEIEV